MPILEGERFHLAECHGWVIDIGRAGCPNPQSVHECFAATHAALACAYA